MDPLSPPWKELRRMHHSTFQYLSPNTEQVEAMKVCRDATSDYCRILEENVPEGPDKTYLIRKLREVAMWANVAITRHEDGSPRE